MSRLERSPTHPGEILREDVLPALGRSKTEIARDLGISRQQLYGLLDESRPVSPNIAVRLGKLCGNGPGLWLRMQAAFDLWHAEKDLADDVQKIPTIGVIAPGGKSDRRAAVREKAPSVRGSAVAGRNAPAAVARKKVARKASKKKDTSGKRA